MNYPEALRNRRMPGDIDLWCAPPKEGLDIAVQTGKDAAEHMKSLGVKAVIEYVKMQHRINGSDKTPRPIYHHVDAPAIDGIEVEVHYRTGYVHSPLRNWRMQRWFSAHHDECAANRSTFGFSMPTPSVNVIYQITHLFSHYFQEGIGLKQFLDLYFTLIAWKRSVESCGGQQSQGMWCEGMGTPVMSAVEVMEVVRSFGMGKFVGAVMWIINEVFVGEHENENSEQQRTEQRVESIKDFLDVIPSRDGRRCNQQEQHKTTLCPQADGDEWSEISRNGQELKEIYIYPRMTQMDTDCCPQADFEGEQLLINDERLMINDCPWLLCEPNEVEGKKLLEEIMKGGNFGQYDERGKELKNGGMVKHGIWKLKRVMRLMISYPEEALWEPVFRVWHLGWRKVNG